MTATFSPKGTQPASSNLVGDSLQGELAQLALINKQLLGKRSARHAPPHVRANKPKELDFQAELAQLAAVNQALLSSRRVPKAAPHVKEASPPRPSPAQQALEQENALLRARIHELENELAKGRPAPDSSRKEQEYEALLAEKSEVIRTLQERIQAIERPGDPTSSELVNALRELEEERQRLTEDQKAFHEQGREMETSLAKERAELARQRNDLQRLEGEIERVLGQSGCDPVLREKLMSMQRRPSSRAEFSGPTEVSSEAAPPPAKKTGLLRRLFG